jgi:hypothetical protein
MNFRNHPKDLFMSEPTASNDGESPIIVSLTDAAMHMYSNAIETLPDPAGHEFPERQA